MKMYGMLGGIENITELFKEISIKHLQLETIGLVLALCVMKFPKKST